MLEFVIMPLLLGYLIGSIPFGLLLTGWAGLGDIRKIGSGNIGATNVLRTGNKKLALLTLLLDIVKGAFAVYIGARLGFGSPLLVALAAVLGHCFPVWLKFKGGKGVATALGVCLVALPQTGVVMCILWAVTFLCSRISSLSALVAFLAAPLATFFFYGGAQVFITSAISALVIIRHRDNIKRLMRSEEPKFKAPNADANEASQ
ncbi:MAG: glycerol-3-phosphate 1-O-acyltransferase PlsY [Alphaproteobacteria bacterium]